jgi:hypothetical protein
MFHFEEIPYSHIEALLVGAFILALAVIHLWRTLKSELRKRECVFCGKAVPSDEHAHHLEICGLRRIYDGDRTTDVR